MSQSCNPREPGAWTVATLIEHLLTLPPGLPVVAQAEGGQVTSSTFSVSQGTWWDGYFRPADPAAVYPILVLDLEGTA